jgi:hypothetical protein
MLRKLCTLRFSCRKAVLLPLCPSNEKAGDLVLYSLKRFIVGVWLCQVYTPLLRLNEVLSSGVHEADRLATCQTGRSRLSNAQLPPTVY